MPAWTATSIAHSVRSSNTRAQDVVADALERVRVLDASLNAFTTVRAEEALAEAAALDRGGPGHDGLLAGVPVAVKEEYDVTGLPTTLGGRGNSRAVERDDHVVAKLRAAGAIIVGKTNTPEFGQFPLTESELHGTTRNPWDLSRSPGGSSGGSAAAVAAGMVPVGMSADGGGSIRIPASACGLVGLKPQRGSVSASPWPQRWHGLATLGAITATVADAALVLDVISGSTSTDRWRAAPPSAPFSMAARSTPGPLKILGATTPVLTGQHIAPDVVAASTSVLDALVRAGHDVVTGNVRWPASTAAFLPLYFSGMRHQAQQVQHPELLERRTRTSARLAAGVRPAVLTWAQRRGGAITAALEQLFEKVDLIVLPTLTQPPPGAVDLAGRGWLGSLLRCTPLVGNTAIFNVSGHPVMNVPAGRSADGLPIGVQLVAPLGREDRLFSVAGQLESHHPWPRWEPPATG